MPDTMTDTVETIDAQGHVGAQFTGHVVATGLDLTAADGNVQNVNRIRWLRAADGALVASISGNELAGDDVVGGPHSSFLNLQASGVGTTRLGQVQVQAVSDFDPNFGTDLILYSAGPTNGASPRRVARIDQDDDNGQGQSYRIIGSDGSTSFVRKVYDVVLGASAASIPIPAAGSLPLGCTHYRLELSLRGDAAVGTEGTFLRFNGDAGTSYDYQVWRVNAGAGASISAGGAVWAYLGESPAATATANAFSTIVVEITDVQSASKLKGFTSAAWCRQAAANYWTSNGGGDWASGNPVTSMSVLPNAGNWIAGCRATLYVGGTA
jgi:hypothetical protein